MKKNLISTLAGKIMACLRRLVRYEPWPTQEDVAEFKRVFPGKCMICSFHRFGYENGMTKDPQPERHDCCESNKKCEQPTKVE